MRRWIACFLTGAMLLSGCTPRGDALRDATDVRVSGARSALFILPTLSSTLRRNAPRPGAALSIYSGLFLSQGIFLPVQAATRGIQAYLRLSEGQKNTTADETFALLQEFANVLGVDIADMLNRSPDRREALERYLQTMRNLLTVVERKTRELETSAAALEGERRAMRSTVRALEQSVRKALQDKDYEAAGREQETLTEAQGALAGIASREQQTKEVLGIFRDLLRAAEERLLAIEQNRKVLISGLKVVKVPGVEDVGVLLDRGTPRRSQRGIPFHDILQPDAD